MNEQLNIRQSLLECAAELSELQNSNTMSFTEVEQRHGRADGKLVELHDRIGAPVVEKKEDAHGLTTESFIGHSGGVCLNCPVLEAGDGCALRDSFHEITAERRARSEELAYREPASERTSRTPRKVKSGRANVPTEIKKSSIPEDQLAANEDAATREQRIREIEERAKASEEAVASIYRARRAAYGYPGSGTRLKQTRNELNQDHTDHIAADD